MFGVAVAFLGAVGVIASAYLGRGARAQAGKANEGVAALLDRMEAVEAREQRCIESLEWAYDEIRMLRGHVGLPVPAPPPVLRPRRRPLRGKR